MRTELAPHRVRLRTQADLVDAIPYIVGFPPENSLVILALHGERKRLGIGSRIDLPDPRHAGAVAAHAVEYLVRDAADKAVAVFYPPTDGPEHPSVRPIAGALDQAFESAGIELIEILCVGADRWWSLRCAGGDCCPADGRPLPDHGASVMAASAAVRGVALYGSRDKLAHSIDLAEGPLAAAMAAALPTAREDRAARVAAGDRLGARTEFFELLTRLVEARVEGAASALTVEEASQLIVGLDDISVRDAMLTWHGGDWGDATRALFGELVTLAAPPHDIAPLTVLAWLAYLHGDGALVNVIIDRTLGPDPRTRGDHDGRPGYNLMRILDEALSRAVNPQIFRDSLGERRWADDELPVIPQRPAHRRLQGSRRHRKAAENPGGAPRNTRSQQRRRR